MSKVIAPSRLLILLSLLPLANCAQVELATADAVSAVSSVVAPASDFTPTALGTFTGLTGHTVTGTAEIGYTGSGWAVVLGEDFTFDGAPDPKVGLGNGEYVVEAQLAPLASYSGSQSYAIPSDLDVADFNQVYIWCEQFTVSLGVADLDLL